MFTGEWIFKDNIYAGTALDVMLAAPEKRKDIVKHWCDVYLQEDDKCFKYEAELHLLAALNAAIDMKDRVITEEFPGWHMHLIKPEIEPWWNWMRRHLEG